MPDGMVTGTEQLLNEVCLGERGTCLNPIYCKADLPGRWETPHSRPTWCLEGSGSLNTLAYLCGQAEDLLNQLLCLRRLFQEQLHYSSQQGELHLREADAVEIRKFVHALAMSPKSQHPLLIQNSSPVLTALQLFFAREIQHSETQTPACCKILPQTRPRLAH